MADKRVREPPPQQLVALRTLARHLVNALELPRLVHRQAETIDSLEKNRREREEARAAAERATQAKSRFLAAIDALRARPSALS